MSTATWRASEPYAPRPVRYLEQRDLDGWRVKLYSIVYGDRPLDRPVYEDGLGIALATLPRPAVTPSRPGVAFAICHQGRGVHYLVLCWWDNENEFFNRVFVRTIGGGGSWRPASGGESACVWDLQVIWFEREAYVETVLGGAHGADVDAYLARRLRIDA